MAIDGTSGIQTASDRQDRWWPTGPLLALLSLITVGALPALFLLLNYGMLVWILLNGYPEDWCPPDLYDCAQVQDANPLVAVPQFLIPTAIIGSGWLLAGMSFLGPKTIQRRPRRWALSLGTMVCSMLAYAWIFHGWHIT